MSKLLKVSAELIESLSGEDFILISDTSDGGIFKLISVSSLFGEAGSMFNSNSNHSIEQFFPIFIGQLLQVAFNYAPKGWALCDGQMLLIKDNQALFRLIGTTYGGNGTTNFALPDLRGRFPLGIGNGDGVANVALGQKAGQVMVSAPISGSEGGGSPSVAAFPNNQIPTVPPYLGINYIIAIEGIFPN